MKYMTTRGGETVSAERAIVQGLEQKEKKEREEAEL